jgi:hypothetical protein
MYETPRILATTLIGAALGAMLGPLSLPADEDFPDRNPILATNERAAALVTAAGLAGSDFTSEDLVGLQSILEAAVALVERYELVAG